MAIDVAFNINVTWKNVTEYLITIFDCSMNFLSDVLLNFKILIQ